MFVNTPANPKFLSQQDTLVPKSAESGASGVTRGGAESHSDAEDMIAELRRPLDVQMKQIQIMQKRFVTTFPWSRLGSKLRKKDFEAITTIIESDDAKDDSCVALPVLDPISRSYRCHSPAPEKRRQEVFLPLEDVLRR